MHAILKVTPKTPYFFLFVWLAVITGSCGALRGTPDQLTSAPAITRARAPVSDLEILLVGEHPVEAFVLVRGNLPDTCTFLENVAIDRDGTRFTVILTTQRMEVAGCLEMAVPYERLVALDTKELPAGTYQVFVNSESRNFDLEIDNRPSATARPDSRTARISGIVWHDLCGIAGGTMANPEIVTAGCTRQSTGSYLANGRRDTGEPGLEGIEVLLGAGSCPQKGILEARTDEGGRFTFSGLQAGTYCVFVDAISASNRANLIPGRWSAPSEDTGYRSVSLEIGQRFHQADFGWDFDRLPAVNPPDCILDAQFLEDVTYPDETVLPPGHVFTKTWRVRNTGTCHWGADQTLDFLAGDRMDGEPRELPTVLAGDIADLSVRLIAPLVEGQYRGDWVLRDDAGEPFGSAAGFDLSLYLQITVDEEARRTGQINGLVWDDRCTVDLFDNPTQGCIPRGLEDYIANGTLDAGETGIAGVLVELFAGPCLQTLSPIAESLTDSSGRYEFEGLSPSTYCIRVDSLHDTNQPLLLPGLWTSPELEVGEQEVVISQSDLSKRADFGWDFHQD